MPHSNPVQDLTKKSDRFNQIGEFENEINDYDFDEDEIDDDDDDDMVFESMLQE